MNKLQPMWNAKGYNIAGINENNLMNSYSNYNPQHKVKQFKNGRVIGLSETKSDSNFQLMEVNNNKDDDAKKTILYGTQVRTPLRTINI